MGLMAGAYCEITCLFLELWSWMMVVYYLFMHSLYYLLRYILYGLRALNLIGIH